MGHCRENDPSLLIRQLIKTRSLLVFLLVLTPALLPADVSMPAIFSNHMVLAKVEKVPVWGKADPGEEVAVTLQGQTASAKADDTGRWKVFLDLKDSAPGPFEMTVEGKNKLTISDVVVGEVWLASGQSNMQWPLNQTTNAAADIAASANPMIRVFTVKNIASPTPRDDVKGAWVVASPQTSSAFTAVGYFFARKLQKELQTPVGVINSSWGGTPSEAWTSAEALDTVSDLKASRERQITASEAYPNMHKTHLMPLRHGSRPTAGKTSRVRMRRTLLAPG